MKLRMVITVDIDPHRWTAEYPRIVDADGKFTIADVRNDIRTHVQTMLHGSLSIADDDVTVDVK